MLNLVLLKILDYYIIFTIILFMYLLSSKFLVFICMTMLVHE